MFQISVCPWDREETYSKRMLLGFTNKIIMRFYKATFTLAKKSVVNSLTLFASI